MAKWNIAFLRPHSPSASEVTSETLIKVAQPPTLPTLSLRIDFRNPHQSRAAPDPPYPLASEVTSKLPSKLPSKSLSPSPLYPDVRGPVPTSVGPSRRPWARPDGRGPVPTAVGPSRRPWARPDGRESTRPCPFNTENLAKF